MSRVQVPLSLLIRKANLLSFFVAKRGRIIDLGDGVRDPFSTKRSKHHSRNTCPYTTMLILLIFNVSAAENPVVVAGISTLSNFYRKIILFKPKPKALYCSWWSIFSQLKTIFLFVYTIPFFNENN